MYAKTCEHFYSIFLKASRDDYLVLKCAKCLKYTSWKRGSFGLIMVGLRCSTESGWNAEHGFAVSHVIASFSLKKTLGCKHRRFKCIRGPGPGFSPGTHGTEKCGGLRVCVPRFIIY
jgi:hypothetical protein